MPNGFSLFKNDLLDRVFFHRFAKGFMDTVSKIPHGCFQYI